MLIVDIMKNRMQVEIPSHLSDLELLSYLYPVNFPNEGDVRHSVNLLHRICIANLVDNNASNYIANLILTKEEQELVMFHKWSLSENKEVSARCCDVLCRFEKDKREILKLTSMKYIEAYIRFGDVDFLIRAVSVRNIKALIDNEFPNVIIKLINKNVTPFCLNKLISALLKSYKAEQLDSIHQLVFDLRENAVAILDYRGEREIIKILYNIINIDNIEYSKQLALSYECEADNIVSDKQPNTYYPNLPNIYQKSYNAIFEIKQEEPAIFERIQNKLVSAKKEFTELLSFYGIKTRIEVSDEFKHFVEVKMQSLTISTINDAISLLLSIPFVSSKDVNSYMDICRKAGPMSSLFTRTQLTDRGNIIGAVDPDNSLRVDAHIYFRHQIVYMLLSYLHMIKWSGIEMNSDWLYSLLLHNKSDYVDEDRLVIWSKGLMSGFKQDYVAAAHILMPQLECLFRNFAEQKKGVLTALEKRRQEEPNLGRILPAIENFIKNETFYELKSFLQEGVDVNFRNNLLHGFLSPFEMDRHGVYLWWICIKIFFGRDWYIKEETPL